ncbi:MAG: helix-turn-helix transcriptional regulator [Bacteroidales bacterium]
MSAAAPERAEIGAAATFVAEVSQDLRQVPILSHCLVLVCEGAKELVAADGSHARMDVGDVALLYAGGRPSIGNRPSPAAGRYVAQVLVIGPRAVAAFRQHYPSLAADGPAPPQPWHLRPADAVLAAALRHAHAGLEDAAVSERMALHRCVEVLAVMAERGLLLPGPNEPSTVATVQALVAARPHLPWAAGDAARALGVSEPTLRRRLAAEGTSFRDIAAEMRLAHGLILLQTTRMAILEVALACGYESPSRFASRFRDRFGMSPSELRGQRGD